VVKAINPMTDKNRIYAKRDFWITSAIIIVLLILGISILIMPEEGRGLVALLMIPVAGFLGWLYFSTYTVFQDDFLLCKSGPFTEKIRYADIKSLKLCRNFMSSMALARDRIEIRQHNKSYVSGTTYISPPQREQFLEELKKRCPNLNKTPE